MEAEFPEDIIPRQNIRSGTLRRHSLRVDGIADTPLRPELRKLNFVKTFPSERSCGTLP